MGLESSFFCPLAPFPLSPTAPPVWTCSRSRPRTRQYPSRWPRHSWSVCSTKCWSIGDLGSATRTRRKGRITRGGGHVQRRGERRVSVGARTSATPFGRHVPRVVGGCRVKCRVMGSHVLLGGKSSSENKLCSCFFATHGVIQEREADVVGWFCCHRVQHVVNRIDGHVASNTIGRYSQLAER